MIYLDNNATTRVAPEVIEAMLPFLTELWGNPSSLYPFATQVARHLEKARAEVARVIGARRPSEIIFTSGGTEGNNAAIRSALAASSTKRRIITTAVEHPSVLELCRSLAKENGDVVFLPVARNGQFDLNSLSQALSNDTALVTIMWANNETGVVFPMEQIAELCAARAIPLHVDAVQAVGKFPIDVSRIPLTTLAFSAHKIHGPKGVGVLYVRRGTKFHPLIVGGHQEGARRAGTENVASIVGLGKACQLAREELSAMEKIAELRDQLESAILTAIPDTTVNGAGSARLPNTTNISFAGIESEATLLLLAEHGICASSGSACTAGSLEPSHVLKAMGVPLPCANGAVRFSLSRLTTEAEINTVRDKLPALIARLRGAPR